MRDHIQVITIGELMLGLRAPNRSLLAHTPSFDCLLTGSEINVAIGLACLGLHSAWIGKLPDNEISRGLVSQMVSFGVNTDHIVWAKEGRLGVMYIELGVPPRPNKIYYDRKHSAASLLCRDDLEWTVFEKADHIHLTGITPALSGTCEEVVFEALRKAKSSGMTSSFDMNYRSQLWEPSRAASVLGEIARESDILFISNSDARQLFNIEGDAAAAALALKQRFQNRIVIVSSGIEGGAAAGPDDITCRYPSYVSTELNRIGAGDAFIAGFLFGYLTGGMEKGLKFGPAVAALKVSVERVNYSVATLADAAHLIASGTGMHAQAINAYEAMQHNVVR